MLRVAKLLHIIPLLGLVACASMPRPSPSFAACLETSRQGIFTTETLACFPEMAEAVEKALCRVDPQTGSDLRHLGIGEGTVVYDQTVLGGRGREYIVDQARADRWRGVHCESQESLVGSEEWLPVWQEAYAQTPTDLLWPWQTCMRYFRQFWHSGGTRLLACTAIPGDGGEIVFGARWFSDVFFDLRIRLREELKVEGATCSEPWRRGSTLAFSSREIACQRHPGKTTVFRLDAGKYSCEVTVPPDPEVSWREKCAAGGQG